MWTYYLRLGFLSLRRAPVLTTLMVMTLAAGVAASVTTLTILTGMSGNPIPHKDGLLLVPLMDNEPVDSGPSGDDPPNQLTWMDAEALWTAARGLRQVPIWGTNPSVDSGRPDLPPFFAEGIATGRDFFAMFDVPWLEGATWSAEQERDGARVAVIARSLAERLHGTPAEAMGKTLTLNGVDFRVIGVLDDWAPLPKYYRLVAGNRFETSEEVFLPIRTAIALNFGFNGNVSCSSAPPEPGLAGLLKSECQMIQYWVEVGGESERAAYREYLDNYVREQKALGRFPRELNNRLFDVPEWMVFNRVVADDARTAVWLSLGFLLVCLVNTVSLLLAKFSARPAEIGVRRALGAARIDIFRQYVVEALVIGGVGAAVGVLLTFGALAFIRRHDPSLDLVARLDTGMFSAALLISLGAAMVAGLLPSWRACQVRPAIQLKSQ
ncbi:ABC transporter permease [Pseudomarimonas salicorniae]|uniref:ABC transporter permease n=1 Tax=Pseudomarimonas salicorniae TaxID=2933270 RepID=A0ABT0GCL8_9GAMM|nr:ABC transporter permease [Lysobacter sp. CAU 1642]MCK7592112.1 ABC transporter permease [Lysobacter sp. CAU 1642]